MHYNSTASMVLYLSRLVRIKSNQVNGFVLLGVLVPLANQPGPWVGCKEQVTIKHI